MNTAGEALEKAIERATSVWSWWFVLASATFLIGTIVPWLWAGAPVVR